MLLSLVMGVFYSSLLPAAPHPLRCHLLAAAACKIASGDAALDTLPSSTNAVSLAVECGAAGFGPVASTPLPCARSPSALPASDPTILPQWYVGLLQACWNRSIPLEGFDLDMLPLPPLLAARSWRPISMRACQMKCDYSRWHLKLSLSPPSHIKSPFQAQLSSSQW